MQNIRHLSGESSCSLIFLTLFILVSQVEILKHDHEKLQLQLQNQKFTPADVERINREKRELQQTISSLTKTLEEAEHHKWNEEIALAKAKERVSVHPAHTCEQWSSFWFTMSTVHLRLCLTRPPCCFFHFRRRRSCSSTTNWLASCSWYLCRQRTPAVTISRSGSLTVDLAAFFNTTQRHRYVSPSKDLVAGKSSYWIHVLCCRCAWESSSATWRRRTVS